MILDIIKHAKQLVFDNSKSGLKSNNVQGAVDELKDELGGLNESIDDLGNDFKKNVMSNHTTAIPILQAYKNNEYGAVRIQGCPLDDVCPSLNLFRKYNKTDTSFERSLAVYFDGTNFYFIGKVKDGQSVKVKLNDPAILNELNKTVNNLTGSVEGLTNSVNDVADSVEDLESVLNKRVSVSSADQSALLRLADNTAFIAVRSKENSNLTARLQPNIGSDGRTKLLYNISTNNGANWNAFTVPLVYNISAKINATIQAYSFVDVVTTYKRLSNLTIGGVIHSYLGDPHLRVGNVYENSSGYICFTIVNDTNAPITVNTTCNIRTVFI